VSHTVPRDPPGDDAAPLGEKTSQQAHILEIDRCLFLAKSAMPPPLESSSSFHAFPPSDLLAYIGLLP
jgi:hypothetical protein